MRLILVLLCLPFSAMAADHYPGPYKVLAPLGIDGDTFHATVPIWPGIYSDVAVRVVGVDTPELHATTQCERDLAAKAKAFTDNWLLTGPITLTLVTQDNYGGRVDAVVTGPTGKLADALIAAGLGHPYNGGKRPSWNCQ